MIVLHKMNGEEFILNDDHIETMVSTPDIVITLSNEKKYLVKEPLAEIIEKIKEYKRSLVIKNIE